MPRTKVSRHVQNGKRVRDNTADLENILRDFEIEAESSMQMLKAEHNKSLREVDVKFEQLVRSIPAHILAMTIGEVRKLKDFNEVLIEEKMSNLNMTVKETVQKADEGYLTEGTSRMTSGSESARNKSIHQKISTVSSLKPSQNRRRSKSVSNLPSTITPGPRAMKTRGITPSHQPAPHASRSKYRTPLTNLKRPKAVSVDRMQTITPKVNPEFPFSMLRHARAGEAVFSVGGSPIVASGVTEQTANVNIPVADGILSIRPQNIDPSNLDPSIVQRIDHSTYKHLLTLKSNLDILMAGFNRRFHN